MTNVEMVKEKGKSLTATTDRDRFWLSMHLFYGGSLDKVLQEVIMPIVGKLKEERLIDNFFFIRYWEGGPHIRLRLLGSRMNLTDHASEMVCDAFNHFLSVHPSDSREYLMPANGYPLDSIQWIAYEPETIRYGGDVALPLAEKLFGASSWSVLHSMCGSPWTHDHAIGAALQFHLSLIYSTGMTHEHIVQFCNWMVKLQLHYASKSLKEFDADPEAAQQRAILYFQEKYTQQKHKLIPFCKTFWCALQSKAQFSKEWLNSWISTIHPILSELNVLCERGKAQDPYVSKFTGSENRAISIYASYIHMTNNRLGIPNGEEPYIAFLLARIMSAINQ